MLGWECWDHLHRFGLIEQTIRNEVEDVVLLENSVQGKIWVFNVDVGWEYILSIGEFKL
jgi:hypothetical protein